MLLNKAWEQMPDKLVLYDYIGHNPSKAGLFRSGPILKGDGLVQDWLGNSSFEIGTFCLAVIRCPAFFETFPVILIDEGGTVRADIGFRRASSLNSIEQRYDQMVLYLLVFSIQHHMVFGWLLTNRFGDIWVISVFTLRKYCITTFLGQ